MSNPTSWTLLTHKGQIQATADLCQSIDLGPFPTADLDPARSHKILAVLNHLLEGLATVRAGKLIIAKRQQELSQKLTELARQPSETTDEQTASSHLSLYARLLELVDATSLPLHVKALRIWNLLGSSSPQDLEPTALLEESDEMLSNLVERAHDIWKAYVFGEVTTLRGLLEAENPSVDKFLSSPWVELLIRLGFSNWRLLSDCPKQVTETYSIGLRLSQNSLATIERISDLKAVLAFVQVFRPPPARGDALEEAFMRDFNAWAEPQFIQLQRTLKVSVSQVVETEVKAFENVLSNAMLYLKLDFNQRPTQVTEPSACIEGFKELILNIASLSESNSVSTELTDELILLAVKRIEAILSRTAGELYSQLASLKKLSRKKMTSTPMTSLILDARRCLAILTEAESTRGQSWAEGKRVLERCCKVAEERDQHLRE